MKKYSNYFLATVASITLFASCAPDDSPVADSRDKFVGEWLCKDTSFTNGDKFVYTVNVAKSGDGNEVRLNNFYNLGSSSFAVAEVSENNIEISSHSDSVYIISGSGIYSNEKFSITYQAKLGSYTDNGKAEYQ